jgi:hypothetical protein
MDPRRPSITSGKHLTVDDMARFRAGALPAEDVLRIGRHLAECRECSGAARGGQQAAGVAESLRDALEPDENAPRVTSQRLWIAACAAAAFVGVVGLFVFRQPSRTSSPAIRPVWAGRARVIQSPNYGRADWNTLVGQALAQGDVRPSVDLNALRPPGERVRGSAAAAGGLAPAGVVIESARPRFRWAPVPKAASYRVIVQSGDRQILRSAELHRPEWTPPVDLERDVTLRWQVLVTKKDRSMEEIPSPPAPPALIRVLSTPMAAEIGEARRRVPADPLLVGTLEAHAGLLDDAKRDLAAAADAHPGDAAFARLRDAVASRH